MIEPFQVVAVGTSTLFLVLVIDLVRRRKLTEDYSLVWILLAFAMLVLSTWRGLLHQLAALLDVHYPPAVLLLVLGFFVFAESLWLAVIISRQRRQIERLIEDVAILSARLDGAKAAPRDPPAP
jgi:hypothetical protein